MVDHVEFEGIGGGGVVVGRIGDLWHHWLLRQILKPINIVEDGELRDLLFLLDGIARRLMKHVAIGIRLSSPLALGDYTFYLVKSTVCAGNATLDDVASHFSRATAVAGFGGSTLDGSAA